MIIKTDPKMTEIISDVSSSRTNLGDDRRTEYLYQSEFDVLRV
jgi:hypothetical protein